MGKSAIKLRQEEDQKKISDYMRSLALNHRGQQHMRASETAATEKFLGDMVKPWMQLAIRSTASWVKPKSASPDRQLLSLIKHLFHRYPVPAFFSSVWTGKYRVNRSLNMVADASTPRKIVEASQDWYMCVAQGGSLYKQHAKDILTKKEVHLLLTCPADFPTIEHACWYAVAAAEGASLGLAAAIARSKLNQQPFDDFWKYVARWFAKNGASLNELNDVIDFIRVKHEENDRFDLRGMTMSSLQKRVRDWHYELGRAKVLGNDEWEGHAINNFETSRGPDHQKILWQCNQIKSAKALAEEGSKQRHCVYSYKRECIDGTISIWSLIRRNPENHIWYHALTIELSNNGTIVQARGVANRPPRSDEESILKEFAHVNGLYYKQ